MTKRFRCGLGRKQGFIAALTWLISFNVPASPHAAAGDAERSFSGFAEASGIYIRYGIPGYLPVDNYVDGGNPVAQAVLSSSQNSKAFASLPYPGSTVVAYPGLAAIALGSSPPGYPLYASAFHPTQPQQKVTDPSENYSLAAEAADAKSSGEARLSLPAQGDKPASRTLASSRIEAASGVVKAIAVSDTKGISVGPLSVAAVTSQSTTTYHRGEAEPVSATDLVLEGGRVGEMSFSFGQAGLKVSSERTPVPADEGLDALNKALAPAGMSVHFDAARPAPGGMEAAVFEIVSVAEIPGAGEGTLRIRFGGARSSILLGADGLGSSEDAGTSQGGASGNVRSAAHAYRSATGLLGEPAREVSRLP